MRMNQSFPPLGVALAGLAKVNRLLAIQGVHLRLPSGWQGLRLRLAP